MKYSTLDPIQFTSGAKMTYIEIQQNGTNIFIGEIKFDECEEIIDIIDYLACTGVKA